MNKGLICLFILGVFVSCQSEQKKQLPKNSEKPAAGKAEDFASFFDNFTWDKAFRVQRSDIRVQTRQNDYFEGEDFITEVYLDSSEVHSKKANHSELNIERINLKKQQSQRHIFYLKDSLWRLKKIETIAADQLKDASFLKFLYHFSTDSVYQKERTRYPLIYQTYDESDFETEIIEYLPEDSLEFVNMLPNFSNLLLNESTYRDSDFRLVHFQGRDNGIYIEYHFKKIKGKWFYVRLVNFST